MNYPFPADIQILVGERMATGQYGSEDELLREALRSLSVQENDASAVQRAIDEWKAGDNGTPLKEAFAELRKLNGLS